MMMQAICRRLGLANFNGSKGAGAAMVAAESGGLHVTEGVGGHWHYHLSKPGTNASGLCGARTMYTAIPLSAWGFKGHIGETYCAECAAAGSAELSAAQE